MKTYRYNRLNDTAKLMIEIIIKELEEEIKSLKNEELESELSESIATITWLGNSIQDSFYALEHIINNISNVVESKLPF